MISQDKLDKLKEVSFAFPHQRKNMHGNLVISRASDAKTNFERLEIWRDMLGEELWNFIEENTHPKTGRIMNICANWYEEGASFPLHFDAGNGGDYDDEVPYTNLWVLDKSDDLEGGLFVKGDLTAIAKFVDPVALKVTCPLEVIDPQIGEMVVFKAETLHGITQIKKGYRMSLVIQKIGKE